MILQTVSDSERCGQIWPGGAAASPPRYRRSVLPTALATNPFTVADKWNESASYQSLL